MKQSLTLKLGQHLTMTPQLQQAIRLLQLSTLELRQEIQLAVETNPLLELVEEEDDDTPEASAELAETAEWDNGADRASAETGEFRELAGSGDDDVVTMPEELPVDSAWEDVFQTAPLTQTGADDDSDFAGSERNTVDESLQDHLLWQLNLTPMSDRDLAIARAIIDGIDNDGMLIATLDEIQSGFPVEYEIEADEVAAVLKRVQQFDPPGIAARDLRECLMIQLNQLDRAGATVPWLAQARHVVDEHLDLLAAHDLTALKRKTRLEDEDLRAVIQLIQSLNPRPGSAIENRETEYIVPDVLVRRERDKWLVELNPETAPRVRIHSHYANMVRRADSGDTNTYLRDNLQEARWFLKSLRSRNETLLKVATKIVAHQRGFLEYGEEAMKPLVLHDIAEAVEMHESTISRVTTRKYMHTPRGIFELKYFFSSHVATSTGGEVSSTAIRALIKKLTAEENPRKPLSDSKITAILKAQNIDVARRTVAKYRDLLSIPPSSERKRFV
jgi:RNA polymerase sigma-54 factor